MKSGDGEGSDEKDVGGNYSLKVSLKIKSYHLVTNPYIANIVHFPQFCEFLLVTMVGPLANHMTMSVSDNTYFK